MLLHSGTEVENVMIPLPALQPLRQRTTLRVASESSSTLKKPEVATKEAEPESTTSHSAGPIAGCGPDENAHVILCLLVWRHIMHDTAIQYWNSLVMHDELRRG